MPSQRKKLANPFIIPKKKHDIRKPMENKQVKNVRINDLLILLALN